MDVLQAGTPTDPSSEGSHVQTCAHKVVGISRCGAYNILRVPMILPRGDSKGQDRRSSKRRRIELGMEIQIHERLPQELRRALPGKACVEVRSVQEGSLAQRSGLQPNDFFCSSNKPEPVFFHSLLVAPTTSNVWTFLNRHNFQDQLIGLRSDGWVVFYVARNTVAEVIAPHALTPSSVVLKGDVRESDVLLDCSDMLQTSGKFRNFLAAVLPLYAVADSNQIAPVVAKVVDSMLSKSMRFLTTVSNSEYGETCYVVESCDSLKITETVHCALENLLQLKLEELSSAHDDPSPLEKSTQNDSDSSTTALTADTESSNAPVESSRGRQPIVELAVVATANRDSDSYFLRNDWAHQEPLERSPGKPYVDIARRTPCRDTVLGQNFLKNNDLRAERMRLEKAVKQSKETYLVAAHFITRLGLTSQEEGVTEDYATEHRASPKVDASLDQEYLSCTSQSEDAAMLNDPVYCEEIKAQNADIKVENRKLTIEQARWERRRGAVSANLRTHAGKFSRFLFYRTHMNKPAILSVGAARP